LIQHGIKSEHDRELIEYKPIISYEKLAGANINNVVIPSGYSVDNEIQNVIDRLPSNTTSTLVTFNNKMQGLLTTIESRLLESPAITTPINADAVAEAARNLGIDISNGITYEIYKSLMNDQYNDNYDRQVIIEAWQTYHSDVNGTLSGEYYTELLELNQDFNNIIDFWGRSALKYINPEIALDIQNPSAALSIIENDEQVLINKLILYKKEIDDVSTNLGRHIVKTKDPDDPSNIAYDKLMNKFTALGNEYNLILRKCNVICEVSDVIDKKLNMNYVAIEKMESSINETTQNTFGGKLVDTLESLLTGCLESDFLGSLKRLRVMVKYQLDVENRDINAEKKKADSAFNNKIKKAAQDMCVKDIAVKVGVSHPLLNELGYMPNSSSNLLKPITDKLLKALGSAESAYGNNIVQLYGAHSKNAEAFTRRAIDIADKDISRELYKIFNEIIKHIENGGDSPTTGNLRGWIVGFLSNIHMDTMYDYNLGNVVQLDLQ
jgi:hypothetical protein